MWAVAFLGPLLTAWCITAIELAPLLHRRYVLCSALPLVILFGGWLLSVERRWLQIAALLGSSLWLFTSQGTLNVWMHHQLIGQQRGEDWRAASAWVTSRILPDDELWCASGLIEAASAEIPLSDAMNAYLSFPLRGIYRVQTVEEQTIAPYALWGTSADWRKLLAGASRKREAERKGRAGASNLFIVYRGSQAAFDRRLSRITSGNLSLDAGPCAFGRVQVVKLHRESRQE
jgi:hypothetical protein